MELAISHLFSESRNPLNNLQTPNATAAASKVPIGGHPQMTKGLAIDRFGAP